MHMNVQTINCKLTCQHALTRTLYLHGVAEQTSVLLKVIASLLLCEATTALSRLGFYK